MSRRGFDYACDGCGRAVADDGYQPDGWIHTMAGDDLCDRCHDDQYVLGRLHDDGEPYLPRGVV